MRWITRERVKVDRVACPWLIRKFVNARHRQHPLEPARGAGLEPSPKASATWASDDHAINAAEWIVYDALYAYCQQMVDQEKLERAFSDARRWLTPAARTAGSLRRRLAALRHPRVRLFAYGFLSVVLVLYLAALGLGERADRPAAHA